MRLLLLFAASLSLGRAGSGSLWTPEHSLRIQRIGSVTPSPDGSMAVWTQTRAITEADKSEYLTHIYLYRDGRPQQLTRGDKSAESPQFTPDGKWLLFLSDRDGKKNLYRLPLQGGEAEKLTDWKGPLGACQLSPDGKWLAFTGAEEDKDAEKAKKDKLDYKVIDEKIRNLVLWVTPLEPDANGQRTPRKVGQLAYHVGEFRWSPDSRRIAFEHRPTPDFNDGRKADLAEIEIESGTVKPLASGTASETSPYYSPDGRYLAFVKSADKASAVEGARVALLDLSTQASRLLAVTPDETPRLLGWAPDSKRVLVAEPRRTRSAVYGLPLDGPLVTLHEPAKGVLQLDDTFSKDGTWGGAVYSSASEAPEAFLLNLKTGKQTRLSEANTFPKPAVGETRVITWKGKDGMPVEGLLTLPAGYESGKRYPLALLIHGGPSGVFAETYVGNAGVQSVAAFAAKGYAVLRVNCRGSIGYGLKFKAANFKDWGGGDYHDIMTGVDHVIAQGIADPEHMAVMGWSYGGYMTSWVISQTTRFKAAIVGAGITNVWSMWGTNDIPSVLDDYFGGSPWDQFELYAKRSGLYHARNVKTPTLFLHGENDLRVPIGQAYEYYHALKNLGVTTRMVAYPRMPHGPNEPKFALDIMQRHLDWVEKYAR
jgi:dipeptidyl aminopeptidase/acylaminoacyl peptidase